MASSKVMYHCLTTKQSQFVYNDKGSGAGASVAVYQPDLESLPEDCYMIGQVAIPYYANSVPPSSLVVVKKADPSAKVEHPIDYKLMWNDQGSGGDYDGAFWRVIPPKGYLALGDVVTRGYDKPSYAFTQKFLCFPDDGQFTRPGTFGTAALWTDRGSGASLDGSIWQTENEDSGTSTGLAGLVRVNSGYDKPKDNCSLLCASVVMADAKY